MTCVDDNDRVEILKYLAAAELFERFLHVKYPGAKRFGLEGGESLIPALDSLTKRCSELGVVANVFPSREYLHDESENPKHPLLK